MKCFALFLVVALATLLPACKSADFDARYNGTEHDGFAAVTKADLRSRASYADDDSGAPMPTAAQAERKIIRSADVGLIVEDLADAGRTIERIARDSGGFVLSASETRYQIKIPSTGLDAALETVATLGEVTRRSLSGKDVTSEYVDLEVRLKNAHAARESYEALLRKASTVEEMLKVEKALHEVQERIELLAGRRKFLDEHLALSDISISLRERQTRGPLQVLWNIITWPIEKLWWL